MKGSEQDQPRCMRCIDCETFAFMTLLFPFFCINFQAHGTAYWSIFWDIMRSSRQGCSAADGSIAPQSSVSCSEVPSSILPLELWRVIFLYLPLRDLCHCAQVCSEWYLLVSSLDSTVWKRFFLQSIEWQHPLWPKMDSGEALKPWRHLYREHFHATRAWAKIKDRPNTTSCINIFQRKRESKIIRVGPLCEHESLKSALSVAGEYDKILIAPGGSYPLPLMI